MRISQLSRYTFKVMLTRQDMIRMDPEFEIFDKKDENAKRFISSLIDIIEKSMNTKIARKKLFVEIFEDAIGGCVVYICSNESLAGSKSITDDLSINVVFSLDFKKLCEISSALKKIDLRNILSELYYSGDYRLILKIEKADEHFKALDRLISVYRGSSQISDILFTKEHYKLLCESCAIEKVLSVI